MCPFRYFSPHSKLDILHGSLLTTTRQQMACCEAAGPALFLPRCFPSTTPLFLTVYETSAQRVKINVRGAYAPKLRNVKPSKLPHNSIRPEKKKENKNRIRESLEEAIAYRHIYTTENTSPPTGMRNAPRRGKVRERKQKIKAKKSSVEMIRSCETKTTRSTRPRYLRAA